MFLSDADILAIVAVVDVAIHGQELPVPAKNITARHNLPGRYLEPMLQSLTMRGILRGNRGEAGGYQLARSSRRITVDDILRAVRARRKITAGKVRSLIGRRVVIPALDEAVSEALQRITIHDLVRGAERL
jgi:Rrf2 family transcriptional regulator, iron-sulfur cluster assembly transcription factor